MKPPTKPISSPGRTEKFPPPLMRFLRTSTGSRSRGRSRSSSTMFLRKKNAAIETTQEPSSPKVTCMGQVRVRRARPSSSAAVTGAPTTRRRCCCCWCFPHALFCGIFRTKPKPGSCCQCQCNPVLLNWGFFWRRKKTSDLREASTETGLSFRDRENNESESEGENRVHDANAFVSNSSCSSTPPRNALLLTRCRSAPYRSSSLASRFWGSPLRNEEGEKTEHENREPSESQNDSVEEMNNKDPKTEAKLRFFKELEDSIRERILESEKARELQRRDEEESAERDSARPLVLTRCKSEPARTTVQKPDPPEGNDFREKDKFGFP